MSLLLLFHGVPATTTPPTPVFACWTTASIPVTVFTDTSGLLDTWNYWSTYSWSQIQASNRTWAYLSGDWFVTATTASSTWTFDTSGGSCPII